MIQHLLMDLLWYLARPKMTRGLVEMLTNITIQPLNKTRATNIPRRYALFYWSWTTRGFHSILFRCLGSILHNHFLQTLSLSFLFIFFGGNEFWAIGIIFMVFYTILFRNFCLLNLIHFFRRNDCQEIDSIFSVFCIILFKNFVIFNLI